MKSFSHNLQCGYGKYKWSEVWNQEMIEEQHDYLSNDANLDCFVVDSSEDNSVYSTRRKTNGMKRNFSSHHSHCVDISRIRRLSVFNEKLFNEWFWCIEERWTTAWSLTIMRTMDFYCWYKRCWCFFSVFHISVCPSYERIMNISIWSLRRMISKQNNKESLEKWQYNFVWAGKKLDIFLSLVENDYLSFHGRGRRLISLTSM